MNMILYNIIAILIFVLLVYCLIYTLLVGTTEDLVQYMFYMVVGLFIVLNLNNIHLLFFRDEENSGDRKFSNSLNSINQTVFWFYTMQNQSKNSSPNVKNKLFVFTFGTIIILIITIVIFSLKSYYQKPQNTSKVSKAIEDPMKPE